MKGLPQEKKDHLKTLGYSDAQLTAIDATFASKQTEAEGSGQEKKEVTPATEGVNVVENQAAQGTVAQEQTSKKEAPAGTLSAAEVADAVSAVLTPLLQRVEFMETALGTLAKELSTVQETQVAVAQNVVKATPATSLKELLAQAVFGKVEAQVDGRSSLAKDKPKEAQSGEAVTGVGLIDFLLNANKTAVAQ